MALRAVRPAVKVARAAHQANPTRVSPIWFTASFSVPVIGFSRSDVKVGGTADGAKARAVVDVGDHRHFDIAVAGMRSSGTVTVTVEPRKARDLAGHWNSRAHPRVASVRYTVPDPESEAALGIVADAAGWGARTVDVVARIRSIRWLREDVKPGLRPVLDRARQFGLNVLVLSSPNALVRDVSAYPDVTWWEVDNEPYWKGVDPAQWAISVKNAVIAARKVNPRARFIVPMTTIYGWRGQWKYWDEWLWQAVPDFGSYVDGWSVHPYCDNLAPEIWSPSDLDAQEVEFRRFEVIHDRLAARGVEAPGWITEFGYPTGGRNSLDEATQADYFRRAIQIARAHPYIQAIFLYHLRDWGPGDDDREHYFGAILERSGRYKLAASVIRAL